MTDLTDLNASLAEHLEIDSDHLLPENLAAIGGALGESAVVVAQWMSNWLARGGRLRETTITDLFVNHLGSLLPEFRFIDLGGTERETRIGADIEWWIQGRTQWFHFYVQAKRLFDDQDADSQTYSLGYRSASYSIDPTTGRRRKPSTQIPLQATVLAESARRANVPGVYLLYNPLRAQLTYSSGDCEAGVHCGIPAEVNAVTVISAELAESLAQVPGPRGGNRSSITLSEVAPHAVPVTCLIGCLTPSCDLAWPWAMQANSSLREIVRMTATWEELGFDGSYDRRDPAFVAATVLLGLEPRTRDLSVADAIARVRGGVVSDPPPYVLEPDEAVASSWFDQFELADEERPALVLVQPYQPREPSGPPRRDDIT